MTILADFFDPNRYGPTFRVLTRPLYSWSLSGGEIPERLVSLPPDPWQGDAGKGRWLINRILDHHGTQIHLTQNIWTDEVLAKDPVLGATLHGFEWLRDLRSLGGDQARRLGRMFMREWMMANTRWCEGVWDYPTTATRLSAWLTGYEFFCASADDGFLILFYASLMRQMRHLCRADPKNLSGLDALRVIKGLVIASLSLEGEEATLEDGLAWLDHWVQEEIDFEGMHISRSPAQTITVARNLIDIRAALVRAGYGASTHLHASIDRLMHAIRFFRTSDMKLALFHGTQEGQAEALDALFRVSGVKIRKPLNRLQEAGYESLRKERVHIIADCGLPASGHDNTCTHASLMSFEMSVGRDRMVVNCGTHPSDQTWADHLKASAAHSTLIVQDRNSIELQSNGQMGRTPKSVTVERNVIDGGTLINMAHDGYAPLNGLTHERRLFLSNCGKEFQGVDYLLSSVSQVKPSDFAVRFHLHPRVQASVIQDGAAVLMRLASGFGWRFAAQGATLALEPSIYCGLGSQPRKTMQIVLYGTTTGDETAIAWSFKEES